eukprot:scaffold42176_cov283-Skeletonema_dohrnii-CCMP3373.AAC.1
MYRRMEEAISIPLVVATLSCNYPNPDWGQAYKAIDGNTSGVWEDGSVAHTCHDEGDKWLKIELNPGYSNYFITNIRIYDRTGYRARLVNTQVQILNAAGGIIASKTITDADMGDNPQA